MVKIIIKLCVFIFLFHSILSLAETNDGLNKRIVSYAADAQAVEKQLIAEIDNEHRLAVAEKSYERFGKIAKDHADDYLARSYAGSMSARRCEYTTSVSKLSSYMGKAIPLLDDAASAAKKANQPRALYVVLLNRAEVYSNLPKFFNKQKTAVEDAAKVVELSSSLQLPAKEQAAARLLQARALANSGMKAEAELIYSSTKSSAEKSKFNLDEALKMTRKALDEAK